MKKVLFVTSALGGGGAERVLAIVAKFFQDNGNLVKVVSLISNRHEYDEEETLDNTFIGDASNKTIKAIQRFTKLRKIINEFKPDYMISFGAELNLYALAASIGMQAKVIISERNDPNTTPTKTFIRKVRNSLYKRADYIVFQTRDARNYFSYIEDSKCEIIPNPIIGDLPFHNPELSHPYIFSAGRLSPQKNFPVLIKAFAKIHNEYPTTRLIIAGEGPQKDDLLSLVKELGIQEHVRFIGYTTEVHDYMKRSVLFIMTSNYEGMSNVMLESLAIGVPTICTDCPIGGAKMVIDNMKNGILISIEDSDAAADAMRKILDDSAFAKRIGQAAQEIRNTNSVKRICNRWLSILEKV